MTDKELGKNAEVRTLFSEKFLELSLWRALAEEPLHANFAQEKVMGAHSCHL